MQSTGYFSAAQAALGGPEVPLRVAAVSFVTKQKKPKIGLETKVSKDFLWVIPFGYDSFNTGAEVTGYIGNFVFATALLPSAELPAPHGQRLTRRLSIDLYAETQQVVSG